MTYALRSSRAPAAALAAVAGLCGACSTPCPPVAERVVYEVRPVPEIPAPATRAPAAAVPAIPPAGRTYVRDDPEAEAARRAWLEEHYGHRGGWTGDQRYVPQQEVEPVRVIVEEREPSWRYYVPPINLSLGWWHGSHGHDGWGWGLGWNSPLCWW
jgi:hypothetical protein